MNKYLATVAAVGLIAGVGAANAQSPGAMEKKELPGASQSQPAQPSPSIQKQTPSSTESKQPSSSTVGQAPSSATGAPAAPKAGAATENKTESKSGLSAETKPGLSTDTKSSAQTETKSAPATTGQAASASINLTAQQKTEIRTKVLASAPKVEKVNFSLNVGTVVPRTVHIVAVPETLVVIHPQWRGYRYFVVGDEIVIVEPDSLKIVAVLSV